MTIRRSRKFKLTDQNGELFKLTKKVFAEKGYDVVDISIKAVGKKSQKA